MTRQDPPAAAQPAPTSVAELDPDAPFADFAPLPAGPPPAGPRGPLRQAVTAASRMPEQALVKALLPQASLTQAQAAQARDTARRLVTGIRARGRPGGVEGLVHEYALSSQEGVALMCLAESLLRVPDAETRDALIADKISHGDWRAHMGPGRSLFVNAATWGLVVTGRLTGTVNDEGLSAALTRLISRAGEPVIRRGVDMAMRLMGEQFVMGESIDEALRRARAREAEGFRFSYDMLGEAAMTAPDAERYYRDYAQAIAAIGKASAGRGVVKGPGVSIKLSALHPRYVRAQADRVMDELLPRAKALCVQAKQANIGLNIDAEEQDRLELSLDILEALALDPDLAGWEGLGFVVQAFGKRAPQTLDVVIDLARRSERRLMVRLVKGAYWDAEIKRAQIDGQDGYQVYTRKAHTDVAYLACARKLLAATDVVFPQFATHNAQTLASILALAGPEFHDGLYEFQCLHGMGEALYEQVVGPENLNRPCRVYAPVGSHETLLAYLVRRLLENGANSSFVNRISDEDVPVEDLLQDPAEIVKAMPDPGASHEKILAPEAIYGPERPNSRGVDLADEDALAALAPALAATAATRWQAAPALADGAAPEGRPRPARNPGQRADIVGETTEATEAEAARAMELAAAAAPDWAATPPTERAQILRRAADLMEAEGPALLGLTMREAGKTLPNAVAELREAVDFLRYYALQAETRLSRDTRPLGPVVCISPWNFPLAIFTGQVCAALAAGNAVLAKPAEETPLIAAQAVRLLHQAGVPAGALQFLPGQGEIGAALVAAPQTAGVMFTGSTEVARLIQRQLADRLTPQGAPIPLIAETGGQNAMIVDTTALPEQVVADVLLSAFDSAGQRCSALRVLCLQEETAERTLTMLRGAAAELRMGRTDRLRCDVGPVITAEARAGIEKHISRMRGLGRRVERFGKPEGDDNGTFVAPTLIEIESLDDLRQEVFGPVLHVLRWKRSDLDGLIGRINDMGYGLTFGLHTRMDQTIEHVTRLAKAGNLYVNRNIIGAVVGVQPFGGRGLSGTGPKAGGPMYLGRLTADPIAPPPAGEGADPALDLYAARLEALGHASGAAAARDLGARSALGLETELAGPVGERNLYALHPRGRVLVRAKTGAGLRGLLAAALATGNTACLEEGDPALEAELRSLLEGAPEALRARIARLDPSEETRFAAALAEGGPEEIRAAARHLAELPGPIVPLQAVPEGGDLSALRLEWLLEEVSTSVNTAAAGGNASLMAIG